MRWTRYEFSPQFSKLFSLLVDKKDNDLDKVTLTHSLTHNLTDLILDTQTSSLTKNPSWRIAPPPSVLSWSMPMVAICYKRSHSLVLAKNLKSTNRLSGLTLFRCCTDCKPCMIVKLCTEISSVPICSWLKMESSNWATSMSVKLPKRDFYKHRLAHLTMQVQRSGKISLMTTEVTFGV